MLGNDATIKSFSTGQEPYSILMTLLESVPKLDISQVKILATDIDVAVLDRAASGIYHLRDIEKIPPIYRQKYFERIASTAGDESVRFKGSYGRAITFAPFNLITPSYGFAHKFDFVFCRNVLIYFDHDMVLQILENLRKSTSIGGYLFLGHSEAGSMRSPHVDNVATAVYRNKVG